MKISPSNEFRDEIIRQIQEREFSKREGIHCSDLIYCLNKQALRRTNPLPPDEHEILLFSLGWSTQRWLTNLSKDVAPIVVDEITVTPDALYCPNCKEIFNGS